MQQCKSNWALMVERKLRFVNRTKYFVLKKLKQVMRLFIPE